jgi:lysophospholipase L1-like esterase
MINAYGTRYSLTYHNGYGEDANNINTFFAITDTDTYAENPYYEIGYHFGNAGPFSMEDNWDLSLDDGENNYIEMVKNGVVDATRFNDIYFKRTNSVNLYAKASFSAAEVKNNEKFGKFGLYVITEAGNGLFFYINAEGDGKNMKGKAVGYNLRSKNAWVDGWTNVKNDIGASSYQDGNFIELAIYREKNVFVLFVNGQEVQRLSNINGIGQDTPAYIGIISFNIMLKVKDYDITDDPDELRNYKPGPEDKDYLFIGDSYVDKAFWYDYTTIYEGLSAVNEGVGGTRVDYWINYIPTLKAMYNPKNIIMHIGVNDLNAGGLSADQINIKLDSLFAKLEEAFADAEIHYVLLSRNSLFSGNWNKYVLVNDHVKAEVENDDRLNVIDISSTIGSDAEKCKMYYTKDGIHFNQTGYGLWNKAIAESLGIYRTEGEGALGDTGDFAYSGGWSISAGSAENTGIKEQQIFFKALQQSHSTQSLSLRYTVTIIQINFLSSGCFYNHKAVCNISI